MKTGMIVLAGGIGKRIGRPVPKQFLLLGGNPLIVHVLEKVLSLDRIEQVVITCPASHLEETRDLVANHGFSERFRCIEGGSTRQESMTSAAVCPVIMPYGQCVSRRRPARFP